MGLLHIYCGDGKGKTTSALGLALRAAGAGLRVCFVQLMKGGVTSELNTLKLIPDITVLRCDRSYGFYRSMTDRDKADITACHNKLLSDAFTSGADMIILDEFHSAYSYGLLDRDFAEQQIFSGRDTAEIILTGRDPAAVFTAEADYISEICCRKHPFEKGITARKGIEF
ncbi:MAG: cob(I)yrinic acid a,c-diamide adenosyltransferase [Ruminococcus sp.]|nr:cob(I)yrinic acid a,c-diamide adenosyltransferase [Ruminococcus sp.]